MHRCCVLVELGASSCIESSKPSSTSTNAHSAAALASRQSTWSRTWSGARGPSASSTSIWSAMSSRIIARSASALGGEVVVLRPGGRRKESLEERRCRPARIFRVLAQSGRNIHGGVQKALAAAPERFGESVRTCALLQPANSVHALCQRYCVTLPEVLSEPLLEQSEPFLHESNCRLGRRLQRHERAGLLFVFLPVVRGSLCDRIDINDARAAAARRDRTERDAHVVCRTATRPRPPRRRLEHRRRRDART